nr:hypothetical protein [Tanacetum cinerariifolium]
MMVSSHSLHHPNQLYIMAFDSGPANAIARHAIDEISEFSKEIETPKYIKVFISQEIVKTGCFVRVQREEAQALRMRLAHWNHIWRSWMLQSILTTEVKVKPCMLEKGMVVFWSGVYCLRMLDKMKISLIKKQKLVAELEVLGEREGTAKPFEHMKEIVAHDVVTLGEMETLLAHAQVRVSLKAGFVAYIKERE